MIKRPNFENKTRQQKKLSLTVLERFVSGDYSNGDIAPEEIPPKDFLYKAIKDDDLEDEFLK